MSRMVWPSSFSSCEDLPQREPALGIEAGGRFVHEQHGRPVEDRPGDHQPLGHAAGQRVDRRLRPTWSGGTSRAARRPRPGTHGSACRTAGRGSRGSPTRRAGRSSVFCWDTTPSSCLATAGGRRRRCRRRRPGPTVGITRVVSMPAVVVLPAPFGPSRPKISPGVHASG